MNLQSFEFNVSDAISANVGNIIPAFSHHLVNFTEKQPGAKFF